MRIEGSIEVKSGSETANRGAGSAARRPPAKSPKADKPVGTGRAAKPRTAGSSARSGKTGPEGVGQVAGVDAFHIHFVLSVEN